MIGPAATCRKCGKRLETREGGRCSRCLAEMLLNDRSQSPTVAWTGSNEASRAEGRTTSLFKTTWKNPLPKETVESIDFTWAGTESKPFLVAVTAE